VGRQDRTVPFDYASSGPARRLLRQLVTTRPVAALSGPVLPRLDRLVLRVSGGRTTFAAWSTGLPVVQLTTTGARSGLPRTTSVLGIPDDDGLLVVAANFGGVSHPAWYGNLRADPAVVVEHRGQRRAMVATELHGAQRDVGFAAALALNPGWRRYARRAGDRVIPVLRLAPADD
jgi:deazaflavin-dependent oxidoreductase (nitroreductase family)